jgi:hypothetical protein
LGNATIATTSPNAGSRRSRAAHCVTRVLLAVIALIAMPLVTEAGFLDLEWTAPTTNADGSPLTDLGGYRVYTGTAAPTCPGPGYVSLAAPAPTPAAGETIGATLTSLTAGTTYWVRVSAVDTSGNESACTPAVSGVANAEVGVTPTALGFGSVAIGSTSTLDFLVQNVGATTLTGTATTAAPFSIVSGGTLNVAPGASQRVRVQFAPQAEQVFANHVTFATSSGADSRTVSGTGVVASPAVLQFSQAEYAVAEGNMATITVTRTGGTHGGVTVSYTTSNGTATAGTDYRATSGTLTFGPGTLSQTFAVSTLKDRVTEGAETIVLTLSNPQGGAILATPNPATLTISDKSTAWSWGRFKRR